MSHPLDYPIWNALTTRHQALAVGGALARRYPADVTPFGGLADESAESYAALDALMASRDYVVMFTPEPLTPPSPFVVLTSMICEQMIGMPAAATAATELVRLGAADVPAMMELVALTKPGPFAVRTHELGTFLGIKVDGRLVAMTGERMRPGEYTEMTAVCVHPDHRGRGYAQALLAAVARGITERGEIPFLHVVSDNTSAIALYKRQGMTIRRRIHVTVLGKT